MKINKNELYEFIQSRLQDECYVGLHGIADKSDLVNQYSILPKMDKAKNILDTGIINGRSTTIGLTVKNFGNLDDKDSDKISKFNSYGFYSPSGEEVIMIVAIPYYFSDSNGRKLFGGYKEYDSPIYKQNTMPECITDYIFRDNIPPEMILGFYSYKHDDTEVEYVENPNYYSKLAQEQKDDFIVKWFIPTLSYDVNNNDTMANVEIAGSLLGLAFGDGNVTPVANTATQYRNLLEQTKKRT